MRTDVGGQSDDGRTLAKMRRLDHVYSVAIALFMEQGYEQTSMETIAVRARVSRASVFNYFPRKPSILVEWSRRRRVIVEDFVRENRRRASVDLEEELRLYLQAWAALNERSRDETVACGPASLRETDLLVDSGMSETLARMFDDAAGRGELLPGTDTRLAARSLAAGYFATIDLWIRQDPRGQDLLNDLNSLGRLFLHGTLARAHRGLD